MARSGYWNHNVHYQPVILSAVPPGCRTALDVGCGDGLLAGRLAARCAKVTAIDRNPPMIARARAQYPSGITFIEADFLAYPLETASFDFVCANTSLHHMDFTAALTTMARLLRPGGRLAVIGLASDKSLADTAGTGISGIRKRSRLFRANGTHGVRGDNGTRTPRPDAPWATPAPQHPPVPGHRQTRRPRRQACRR